MGTYANVTGFYQEAPQLMDGQWFVDKQGALYIVPLRTPTAPCEGPDTMTRRILEAMRGSYGEITDLMARVLNLTEVPRRLHRWDPITGFHRA